MDVVYPLKSAVKYEELRFSLRSLRNVEGVDRVWIVGSKPGWLQNVEFVPSKPGGTKWQNIPRALLAICDQDKLSDEFLYFNDDFMILKPWTPEMLHRGSIYTQRGYITAHNAWNQGHRDTAKLLRSLGHAGPIFSYELHVPMPMRKDDLRLSLEIALPHRLRVLQYRTFYGNWYRVGGRAIDDVKPGSSQKANLTRDFLSTSDHMFTARRSRVVDFLKGRFPEPSQYEADATAVA